MPIRRIFGYIGFIISIIVAVIFAILHTKPGSMIIALDTAIISINIITIMTAVIYIIGRIVEKKRRGTIMK